MNENKKSEKEKSYTDEEFYKTIGINRKKVTVNKMIKNQKIKRMPQNLNNFLKLKKPIQMKKGRDLIMGLNTFQKGIRKLY